MQRHIGLAVSAAVLATLSISACKGRGGHNAYDTGTAGGNVPGVSSSPSTSPDSPPGAIPTNTAAPNTTTVVPPNGMMPGGGSDTNAPKADTAHKKKKSAKRHY
jgi:hypothetical protein